MYVYRQIFSCALDLNPGDTGRVKLLVDKPADADVFHKIGRVITLARKPTRRPRARST